MHDYTPAFVSIQVLLSILIWTTSAIAGALIGTPKGRTTEGAIWGLLLGPIGIVIAALLSKIIEVAPAGLGAGPSLRGHKPQPSGLVGEVQRPRKTLGDEMR